MTFSAVGSNLAPTVSGGTFSLTPSTVGDFILFGVLCRSTTVKCTALSSSNVTWSQLVAPTQTPAASDWITIFIGKVTAASAATVTLTYSGTAPTTRLDGQEFSNTLGFSAVTLDTSGVSPAGSTLTWTALTPGQGAGELYFGYCGFSGTVSFGSTANYVYGSDAVGNGVAYNLSCPNASTGPVWGGSAGTWDGMSVLLYESSGTAGNVNLTTPNLALAAPAVTPSGGASVNLTTPNLALAAPAVTPSGTGSATVALTTPNLALAAPAVTPSGGSSPSANVNLTTPNLALAAPAVSPSGAGVGALSVVNQWAVSDVTGYGPADVKVSNTTGNTLVAYLATGSDNPNGYCPRISISDDAHNWWIFAGSKIDPFFETVRRLDIWICPNAQAASVISVTGSMVYAGLTGRIVEFKNFPSFAQIDFVQITSGGGTTGSLSCTASGQDYVFTSLLTAGNTPGSVTYPSWGGTGANVLTNATTGSALTDMSNLTVVPNYWAAPVIGANTVTYSWTNSTNYNLIAIGFTTTPTTPAQPNPNWPGVKIEAAFGFQPGNLTGAMPTWTDITTRAIDDSGAVTLSAQRGRDYELTQPAAGKVTLPLNNQDGAFNPVNTASPFYPNVVPEVPVRVSAVWQGRTYGLAYSYAQKWPQDFPDPQWGYTTYQGGDAIGIASQGNMPTALQGDMLADLPYGGWTLGEFYSAPHGSLFNNFSRTNLKPMIGWTPATLGAGQQLTTGGTLGIAGDPTTGIGTAPTFAQYSIAAGGGVFVRDYGLPPLASGVTLECWAIVPEPQSMNPSSTASVVLLNTIGSPGNYTQFGFPNGTRFTLYATVQTSSLGVATGTLFWVLNGYGGTTIITAGGPSSSTFTLNSLMHIVTKISVSGSTWTVTGYLNGVQVMSTTGTYSGTLDYDALAIGGVNLLGGTNNYASQYTEGLAAIYPWLLPPARIAAHYSTGISAANGDTQPARLGKLMAWSGLQLPFGSTLASTTPLLGNADQIAGTPLTDQLGTLSQTEGGMFYAPATAVGEIWYQGRQSMYNKAPSLVFGDEATVYLNQSWNFSGSRALMWSTTGCTRSQSTAFPYCGPYSLLVNPNVGAAAPTVYSEIFGIQGGLTYACNPVVLSPQGWATGCQIGVNWLNAAGGTISSASGAVTPLVANLPTVVPLGNQTAPANAVAAQMYCIQTGTPGSGVQFYWAGVGMTLAGEIAYLPTSGFDFSDTFLYNIVSSTRTISESASYITGTTGATLATFNNYGADAIVADSASETAYMPRGALQLDIETTSDQDAYDRANWALTKYKQPQLRANQIQLDPASNPAIFGAVLNIEQGDIVTVNRRPIGAAVISVQCIVQQVQHQIGPDNWLTTITLAPYFPENAVLQLDNAPYNSTAGVGASGAGVLPW